MTQYAKPAVRPGWADTATPADIVDPGTTYESAGWQIGVKPPRQYFNWVLNYVTDAVRYFSQRGIPDYDNAESYSAGAVVFASSGLFYAAHFGISDMVGVDPAVVGNDLIHWDSLNFPTPPPGDNSVRAPNTAWVTQNFFPRTTTINTISGQVTNAQVPLSAVQQYQGSLTIAFSQLSGTIFSAQVPLAAVQQWQGNLAIAWGQITGVKNADQLAGAVPAIPPAGSTIVLRDNQGNLYGNYLNVASPPNETASISQVLVTNSSDNFARKVALGWFLSQMTNGLYLANPNGWIQIPGTPIIIQWGVLNKVASTVSAITFPRAFPNAAYVALTGSAGGNANPNDYEQRVNNLSATGFSMDPDKLAAGSSNPSVNCYWIAVGN